MKEQTLLEMKNKIEALTRVIQHLMTEMNHLRELSIGTLETVKLLPGYEDALDQLKTNVEAKKKEEEQKEEKKLEV